MKRPFLPDNTCSARATLRARTSGDEMASPTAVCDARRTSPTVANLHPRAKRRLVRHGGAYLTSKAREAGFKSRISQLWNQLFSRAARIAPMRDTSQTHEIARQRRWRSRDCRTALAQPRSRRNQRKRQIRADRLYGRRRQKIWRDRRTVIHQPQCIAAGHKMPCQSSAEIAGCAGNQESHSHSSHRPCPSLLASLLSVTRPRSMARRRTSSFSQCSQ